MTESVRNLLQSKWMPAAAGAIGFLEGSFVVFPMEPLFLPVMIARKEKAFVIAAFLLIGNVAGAALMYALGAWFAAPVIEPFANWLGAEDDFESAVARLKEHGFAALFLIGVTPFPFQLGTAAAGAVGFSFPMFLAAVTISRGLRYFALAGLVVLLGRQAGRLLERHQTAIFIAGVSIFLVGAIWMITRG